MLRFQNVPVFCTLDGFFVSVITSEPIFGANWRVGVDMGAGLYV
jgi:hypothetical protein